MVQLKTTAQKSNDGKGNADNIGNKEGLKKSSLAAASTRSPAVSAPGHISSLKQPSKGKGGMKAGPRTEDFARVFAGPTDNRRRGGGKAAGSTTMPESIQRKEAAKGRNTEDDRESSKAKQVDLQDTSGRTGKDVLSQVKDHAAKTLESLANERAEGEKSRFNADKSTNSNTGSSSREDRQETLTATYNSKAAHQELTSPHMSGHNNNQERGKDKVVGDFAGGGYNKRRSRSYSPVAITGTRQQHSQDIRISQSCALPTDGVASKWQGIGSPARGTKSYKPPSSQESESMCTHSSSSLSVNELDLSLGEDTMEVEGVLNQIRIYTTGTFNIN